MASYLISLFFLLSTVCLGLFVLRLFLEKKVFELIDIIIAAFIGSTIITVFIFLISWITGGLNRWLDYFLLSAVLIISIFYLKTGFKMRIPKLKLMNLGLSLILILVTIYFWLVFSRLLFFENGNLIAGWVTVWGDWAAHLSYTTSFAYGNNFPPQLPIFAGHVFSYPFLADFLSAILVKLGVELNQALILPGFFFTWAAFILLAYLAYSITKKLLVATITPLLFFFNGGLGFVYVFFYGVKSTEFTKIPAENIQWMSTITSQFIPQRGFTVGFPLTLVIFYLLYQIYLGKTRWQLFLGTGFLISLLPLFHMHSFLVTLFLSGLLYLKTAKYIKQWLIFSLPILLLAVPAILYFYAGSAAINSLRFHLGWMAKDATDILPFLFRNFGLMLLLPVLGFIVSSRRIKMASLPFWAIFIAANLFIFQPWDWDNTKLFTYSYVGATILAAIILEKLFFSKHTLVSIAAILLFLISVFSGVNDGLNVLRVKDNKLQLFGKEQLNTAEYIRNQTPPQAVFLTADNHDNLVPVLTGRKIVLGYPGWLWSYGVNYWERQADINLIKSGNEKTQSLLKKYQVDYVVIGPVETFQGFNKNYFETHAQRVFTNNQYTVYKL